MTGELPHVTGGAGFKNSLNNDRIVVDRDDDHLYARIL